MSGADNCSPGEHPHQDQRNFDITDYLAMVADGETQFSIAEAARLTGLSRAFLYRCMVLAGVPEDEFVAAMKHVRARGLTSTTALSDEIKRRTGKARVYNECCPHCGCVLRERRR